MKLLGQRPAAKLAIANLLVLAVASPASQVAGLPDAFTEVGGGDTRFQSIGEPWVTQRIVAFVVDEPIEIVEVRYERVDEGVIADRAVLWPSRQNGDVLAKGVCGHPSRAGWYSQGAVGSVLVPGEAYSLGVPLRPRGSPVAESRLAVEGVTIIFRLGRRTGDQTFERTAALAPPPAETRGHRCTRAARAHWIYETLRPPVTQVRVRNLWSFVAGYAAGCPRILTDGRVDPSGKRLFARISKKPC